MKTKINTISLLILAVLFAVSASWSVDLSFKAAVGYYVDMPSTGSGTLSLDGSESAFKVYDNAGSDKWCSGGTSDLTMTAPDNYVFQVTGTFVGESGLCGELELRDGTNPVTILLPSNGCVTGYSAFDVGIVRSTSNVLTVYNRCADHKLELNVSLLNTSVTHTVTPATVTGGSATITTGSDALVNTTVSVKLQPSTGYLPVAVNATSSDNFPVKVDMHSSFDNSVTFTMPYGNVSVSPVFTNDLTAEGGLYTRLPYSGSESITIPSNVKSFKVSNEVDENGRYKKDFNGSLVLTAPANMQLAVVGKVSLSDYSTDKVTIFEGEESANAPLFELDGSSFDNYNTTADVGKLRSTGNKITIKLEDDGNSNYSSGLDLVVMVIDPTKTYSVSSLATIAGGSVDADLSEAVYDQMVTLTMTPETGYYLGDLDILSNGKSVPYSRVSTGSAETITFEMPNGDVSVTPHFAKPEDVGYRKDGSLSDSVYFQMKCDGSICTISQVFSNTVTYQGDDIGHWEYFKHWFRGSVDQSDNCDGYFDPLISSTVYSNCDFGLMDVYRALYSDRQVKFVGKLDFGGYDSDAGKCAMQFEPFTGEKTGYSDKYDITIRGDNAVIDGLCQENTSHFGLTNIAEETNTQAISVSFMTIKNAYINAKNNANEYVDDVGVVAGLARNVTVNNVYVENATVKAKSNVGGLVGRSLGNVSIVMSSIRIPDGASLSGDGNNAVVGGIVGNISRANGVNNIDVYIRGTYSIGKIDAPSTNGFVVGSMGASTARDPVIQGNYHFGSDNLVYGIGGGFYTQLADWLDAYDANGVFSYSIYGNIRNANENVTANGSLSIGPDLAGQTSKDEYRLKSGSDVYHNGAVAADSMKTRRFAAVLNGAYNSDWTSVPGKNDGLPFFAGATYSPIYIIGFSTDNFGTFANADNKAAYNAAIASGYIDEGYCGSGCGGFSLFTNHQGHLDQDQIDFLNELSNGGRYWYSSRGAISTSRRYDSNVDGEFEVYQYSSNLTLNVAYYLCVGQYEQNAATDPYVCNGTEYIIKSGEDLADYAVGFLTKPVTEFALSDDALIPEMFVRENSGAVSALRPKIMRFTPAKNSTYSDDVTYTFTDRYFSGLHTVDRTYELASLYNFDGSDYNDTLHLLYSLVTDDVGKAEIVNGMPSGANNSVLPFTYKPLVYDIDGALVNIGSTVASSQPGEMPITPGFTVEAPAGYKLQEYTVELGCTLVQNPSVIETAESYFATPDEFAKNYDTKVWKKTVTDLTELVTLDSVYKGMTDEHVTFDQIQLTMVPTFVVEQYTVSFDLSSFNSGFYIVLGNNWTAKKDNMDVETNNELPKLYMRSISVGGGVKSVEYTAMEWSSKADATPNDPHSSTLTSDLLASANISGSDVALYPYTPRQNGTASARIRVIAVDETGTAQTATDDYHGSIVLTQKSSADENAVTFEQQSDLCAAGAGTNGGSDVYTHCLYVPNADDTLSFKVSLVPDSGYAMTITDQSFKWRDAATGLEEDKPGFGFKATNADTTLVVQPTYMVSAAANNDQMYFMVKYTVTGPFYVTYNMNINTGDEDKLFFPMDASSADKFEFDETVVSTDLWVPFRSDKCFDGWSVVQVANPAVPASEPPKITTLYADYAASALSLDPDAPTELQANWKDCGGTQPAAGDVTIANGGTNAKVMLKQVFDGVEYKHLLGNDAFTLPANSSGYKFFIDSANSVVDLGYEAVGVSATYSVNGVEHELTIEGDSIVVGKTNVSEFSVTMKTQVALDGHRFWLAGNADTVFYGSSITMLEVHAQKDEPITTDVYRIGYKLKGWSFEDGSTPQQQGPVAFVYTPMTHLKFDKYFEDDYVAYAKAYGHLPDTLYAVWEAGGNADVKRVVNKSEQISSFKLMQDLGGQMFDYLVSDTLLLPAEGQFEFIIEMLYDSNQIEVDNMHAIVVLNEDGELDEILENNIRYTVEKSIGLRANVLKDKRVQFVLNENSEDQVYFGSDWIDTLASENPDSALVLPTIAYNSAKCLAGWTIDSTSNKLLKVLDKDLLNDLRAKGNALGRSISELLYARWTTNPDSCVGDFVQLAVQQENGSVWFVEGDKNTKERRFTDEGTMFVPSELDGSQFRVQASGTDTSVYVLDSLVVLRKNKVVGVLKEGDAMPANLKDVSLKAYFGWKNKTEIGFKRNPRLDVNGVRFRVGFKASDFEVRRNVSARVQVLDRARLRAKPPIDTVLGDSIEMGYETTDFMFRMNKPGNYTMVLTLKDKSDSVVTDSIDFSVSSEISVLAADTWQMISLASVDVSAVKDDSDRIFYWWDEEGTGEFWQYKRLDLRDSVDPTLGVWYNSLEGRALPLLTDVDDEDDEEDFTWKLENVSTGWNMVANPHNWTLDLYAKNPNAKKSFDEESDISFWRYDAESAEPVPVDTIGPYEAVWAYVAKKGEWKMSAAPYFTSGAAPLEKRALAKASTKDRWTLQAKLTDVKGKKDSWNILGAGLNPVVAEEPPENMGDHVNLSIVEGKRALAKSIKPSSDEMEWTIALSASSDRIGFLSLDGVDGVKAFGYRVFVTVDGNTTEMREGEPLKVYLKSSAKMATVRVAPAAKVVAKNTLKGLRTARLGNRLQVTFDASGLAGTNARVDIVDLKGNVKSTATAKTVEGSNALVLDAPQSGLYMLRVRAGSQQQAVKILVR